MKPEVRSQKSEVRSQVGSQNLISDLRPPASDLR
jgi:hypothetical protein